MLRPLLTYSGNVAAILDNSPSQYKNPGGEKSLEKFAASMNASSQEAKEVHELILAQVRTEEWTAQELACLGDR